MHTPIAADITAGHDVTPCPHLECKYLTGQEMNEVCGCCLQSHPSQP